MAESVLAKIIANKEIEVSEAKRRTPSPELKAFCLESDPPKDFFGAISAGEAPRIIAECKKQSPSKGVIKEDYDPVAQALAYELGGAAAVSVLTDSVYFGGDLKHLNAVSHTVNIPVLRKDFIIDEYQIYEARRHGADSYLLLAGVLDAAKLQYFIEIGRDLGMEPLVETHDESEVASALQTDARIIGINNRDLKTMQVDFNHALSTAQLIMTRDSTRTLVCESGVTTRDQIEAAASVGMRAFLIGEHLMRSQDPEKALLALSRPK